MTTHVRTQIRIPTDLYERLQESAVASSRSFNAEMIVRLEASFRHGLESAGLVDEGASVRLRDFQRDLLEQVRKIVRVEALAGAATLTREQAEELAALKKALGLD